MARPKKYNIDPEQVEKLAQFGCTNTEIASFFGCDESLIRKSYSENITKGKDKGKIRLRQLMWRTAENGNVTMQIWLSKQYLGMSDKQEVTTMELPQGFDTHHIE
tara:strand:+ start:9812 stop:10126 length:315 start_codon:yes stop_codon:yes gene_type:complete